MKTRNIKINVYLNETEKKMLEEKSSKIKLSQSDFIRKLITEYYGSNITKNNLEKTVNSLSKIAEGFSSLKNQMDFLRYSDYSNFIAKQISNINNIIKQPQI